SSEQPRSEMKYGVSVTDACISWEMTDALLREIHKDFERPAGGARRIRGCYGC
ncbi:phospho-2-dehydro-3-deoxyheptonate aldolase, partial [Salmonella enterica subsp. enterica serovar Heidelberg str. 83-1068]